MSRVHGHGRHGHRGIRRNPERRFREPSRHGGADRGLAKHRAHDGVSRRHSLREADIGPVHRDDQRRVARAARTPERQPSGEPPVCVHDVVCLASARGRRNPFAHGAPQGSEHPQQGEFSAPRGHYLLGHVPGIGQRHARVARIAHALNTNPFQCFDVRKAWRRWRDDIDLRPG